MLFPALLAAFGGAGTVTLASHSLSSATLVGYGLNADGTVSEFDIGGASSIGNWIEPPAYAPGAYECRATLNSGSLDGGTTDEWLALTSDRAWTTTSSANLTIEIRLGSTVLDSATIVLTAT